MSDDGGKLLESLMGMLGENPEEKIGAMLSALSSNDNSEKTNDEKKDSGEESGFDISMLLKLQNIMGMMEGGADDERSALLYALKPFLKSERHTDVDRAVKLLKLSKLAKVAQELELFKNLL